MRLIFPFADKRDRVVKEYGAVEGRKQTLEHGPSTWRKCESPAGFVQQTNKETNHGRSKPEAPAAKIQDHLQNLHRHRAGARCAGGYRCHAAGSLPHRAPSAAISAPPPAILRQVNDFHNWQAWSPWAKLDPMMTQTYAGEPAGKGAVYTWAGNNEVGEGKMTLMESRPNELIQIKLEFLKPFAATNTAEFTFKPDGDRTVVTWSHDGPK